MCVCVCAREHAPGGKELGLEQLNLGGCVGQLLLCLGPGLLRRLELQLVPLAFLQRLCVCVCVCVCVVYCSVHDIDIRTRLFAMHRERETEGGGRREGGRESC